MLSDFFFFFFLAGAFVATILVKLLQKRLGKSMHWLLLCYARLPTMNVYLFIGKVVKDHYNKGFEFAEWL